jgi:hypothetical protein
VARYNLAEDPARLKLIADGLDCAVEDIPDVLEEWFDALGIGAHIAGFVAPEVTDQLGDNLINRARAANNLRNVDGATARKLARRSLERFCSS